MVDIENDVFNALAVKLRAAFNPISIYGRYFKTPPVFPSVTIEERDNYVYEPSRTGTTIENHAVVMYEINVYSNRASGAKSQCKDVFALIDGEMAKMGFTRIMLQAIPNMEDATIYRMTGRYNAVVSTNKTVYRR